MRKIFIVVLILVILLVLVVMISRRPLLLSGKTETIEVSYVTWACDCANWITHEDYAKFEDAPGDALAEHSIFIQAADPANKLPDSFLSNGTVVRFTGQFYVDKGVAPDYESKTPEPFAPAKARVFRYTKYKVLSYWSQYQMQKDLERESAPEK